MKFYRARFCEDEFFLCSMGLDREMVEDVFTGFLLKKLDAMDDPSQRENFFYSKCLIKENICSLIIDSESFVNVASTTLVEFLKLLTTKYTAPYKLQWLSECGELRVHWQVLIKFKRANYKDKILCDVVSLQACHVFLGRSWQYNRSTKHDGRNNRYSLFLNGHKYTLQYILPL